MQTTVIVIPADQAQPARIERVPDAEPDRRRAIGQLVGGPPEPARYDPDATVYVREEGSQLGLAPNVRATRYALEDSQAARQRRQRGTDAATPSWYVLYGDVVIAGESPDGTPTPGPPARLADLFGLGRDVAVAKVAERLGEEYGRRATLQPPPATGPAPTDHGDVTPDL